jgi:acyl dehydratase
MVLYLEDLSPGMRFTSTTHALDGAQVREFAAAFDPQPFHLDDEGAAGTIFGTMAASGWHVAAISMKLLIGAVPVAGGIVGGGGELAWPSPTRPDDILHVVSEIVEVIPSRSKPDRGMGILRSETRNQNGDVRQVFTAKLVLRRRPAG